MTDRPGLLEKVLGGPPLDLTLAGSPVPHPAIGPVTIRRGRTDPDQRPEAAQLTVELDRDQLVTAPLLGDPVTVDLSNYLVDALAGGTLSRALNLDLEAEDSEDLTFPEGWRRPGWYDAATYPQHGNATLDATLAASGSKSLHVHADATPSADGPSAWKLYSVNTPAWRVEPGQRWDLATVLRTNATGAGVAMSILTVGFGNQPDLQVFDPRGYTFTNFADPAGGWLVIPAANTWTPFRQDFVVPDGFTYMMVTVTVLTGPGLGLPADTAYDLWVDHLEAHLVTAPVLDSFTRADNPASLGNADTGQPWTADAGTWGTIGSQAYTSATAPDDRATLNLGASDFDLAVSLPAFSSGAGLVFRQVDLSSFWIFLAPALGSPWELWMVNGWAWTLMGTATGTPAALGQRIRVRATGPQLDVYVNSRKAVSVSSAWHQTATRAGLRSYNNTAVRFDDFRALTPQLAPDTLAVPAATRPRFRGTVVDLVANPASRHRPRPTVTLTAVGPRGKLGQLDVAAGAYPAELDGARASRVLTEAVALDATLSVGVVNPGAFTVLARAAGAPSKAQELLDQLAVDTGGELVELRAGTLTWQDGNARTNPVTAVSLGAAEILAPSAFSQSLNGMVTGLTLGWGSLTPQATVTVADTTAPFRLDATMGSQLTTAADASSRATDIVGRRSTPRWRIVGLGLELLRALSRSQALAVLGLDFASLIHVAGLPSTGPFLNADLFVEGWTESWSRDSATMALDVSDKNTTGAAARWADAAATDGYTRRRFEWRSRTFYTYTTGTGPSWADVPASLTWLGAVAWDPGITRTDRWIDQPATTQWTAEGAVLWPAFVA